MDNNLNINERLPSKGRLMAKDWKSIYPLEEK
jgi:hypothetical protein